MIEKIFVGAIIFNALINLYLIISDSRKRDDKAISSFSDSIFFRAYALVVPFFLTKSILKEINKRKEKEKLRKNKYSEIRKNEIE